MAPNAKNRFCNHKHVKKKNETIINIEFGCSLVWLPYTPCYDTCPDENYYKENRVTLNVSFKNFRKLCTLLYVSFTLCKLQNC